MSMTLRYRRLVLTAHVATSVGWLGAVAAFLALAIAGLTNWQVQMMRAAYLAMELTATWVIVPLCLASLLTGIVSSLGTRWGLIRQYWVLLKFLITLLSTLLLLMHMPPIHFMAGMAADTMVSSAEPHALRIQLVIQAAAALISLVVATTLAVYKPKGITPYGWRKLHEQRAVART